MKKSFVIIGLGRFGLGIVKTLSELKSDVIAIDVDKERVSKAAEYIDHCVICDATKINNLRELGVNNVDHAVVAIGNNLQATLLTTINLKELGIKQITVRVDDVEYVSVMERIGATEVIVPEEASAHALANQIVSDSILDYHKVEKDFGLIQIKVSPNFNETSLIDLDLRNTFDVNVVGIIRDKKFFIPKGHDLIKPLDIVTVIGKTDRITKFDRFINK